MICYTLGIIAGRMKLEKEDTMARKTAGKKRSARPAVRKGRKKKEASIEEIEASMEKMALKDFAKKTRDDLTKLGDKIHEATDRGMHVVKEIAEEVQRFAKDATERTRIKMELHNLKGERDKLYALMGEQLRNLYRSNQLSSLKKRFRADFEKLDELEHAIEEHEQTDRELSAR